MAPISLSEAESEWLEPTVQGEMSVLRANAAAGILGLAQHPQHLHSRAGQVLQPDVRRGPLLVCVFAGCPQIRRGWQDLQLGTSLVFDAR